MSVVSTLTAHQTAAPSTPENALEPLSLNLAMVVVAVVKRSPTTEPLRLSKDPTQSAHPVCLSLDKLLLPPPPLLPLLLPLPLEALEKPSELNSLPECVPQTLNVPPDAVDSPAESALLAWSLSSVVKAVDVEQLRLTSTRLAVVSNNNAVLSSARHEYLSDDTPPLNTLPMYRIFILL